jgi:putative mRNA 3-end processing factor
MIKPQDLLCPKPEGLYCAPGDFYIDPVRPVERAVITHGHSDHARAGHGVVLATPPDPGHHGRALRPRLRRRHAAVAYGETSAATPSR